MTYSDSKVEYLEKPITRDEKEIADIFDKLTLAINKKNQSLLFSLFSDSAGIKVFPEDMNFLSKSEYEKKMSIKIYNIRSICYRDVLIRVKNETEALGSFLREIFFIMEGSCKIIPGGYFKFEKSNNIWKIMEAR